jgi:hypothetical protein
VELIGQRVRDDEGYVRVAETRGERDLVITSECLRQGLGCDHARKATADN